MRPGGGDRALGSLLRIKGQGRRALQKRSRGRQPSPGLGSAGRELELGRHLFVRARRGQGEVPGPAVGVDTRGHHVGQGPVDPLSFRHRRRVIGGRAGQGMREADGVTDLDEASAHGGKHGLGAHTDMGGGSPHQHHVADRLGRDNQQQPLRLSRQLEEPAAKGLLETPRQRPTIGNP